MWGWLFVVLLVCKIIGIGSFSAWWLLLPIVMLLLPVVLFVPLLCFYSLVSLIKRWIS